MSAAAVERLLRDLDEQTGRRVVVDVEAVRTVLARLLAVEMELEQYRRYRTLGGPPRPSPEQWVNVTTVPPSALGGRDGGGP